MLYEVDRMVIRMLWDNYKYLFFFYPLLIFDILCLEKDDALYLKAYPNVIHFLALVSY